MEMKVTAPSVFVTAAIRNIGLDWLRDGWRVVSRASAVCTFLQDSVTWTILWKHLETITDAKERKDCTTDITSVFSKAQSAFSYPCAGAPLYIRASWNRPSLRYSRKFKPVWKSPSSSDFLLQHEKHFIGLFTLKEMNSLQLMKPAGWKWLTVTQVNVTWSICFAPANNSKCTHCSCSTT